jgi:hypothetical protein
VTIQVFFRKQFDTSFHDEGAVLMVDWSSDEAELRIFLGRLAADSTRKDESNAQWQARLRRLRDIIHAKLDPSDE